MKGSVYVLKEVGRTGAVKIGYTDRNSKVRVKEIDGTGNPYALKVAYSVDTNNPRGVEQKVHQILSSKRLRKEWFKCSVEEAVQTIQSQSEVQEAENSRKENFYKEQNRKKQQQLFQKQQDNVYEVERLKEYKKSQIEKYNKTKNGLPQKSVWIFVAIISMLIFPPITGLAFMAIMVLGFDLMDGISMKMPE